MRRVTRASSPELKQKSLDESFNFAPSPKLKPREKKRNVKASLKRDKNVPPCQTRLSRKKAEAAPSLLSKLMDKPAQFLNFVWSKIAYRPPPSSSVSSKHKHAMREEPSMEIADDRTLVDS